MRRRQQNLLPEPPARLLEFNPADWLPLVDATDYSAEMYRNRGVNGPYGEPSLSFENWKHQQARTLWGRARRAWHDEHGGCPGGLSPLDLLREEMALRRAATRAHIDNNDEDSWPVRTEHPSPASKD